MAEQGVLIHAAHWPGLSKFGGFEMVATIQNDAQSCSDSAMLHGVRIQSELSTIL